jgi:hypothetical protein
MEKESEKKTNINNIVFKQELTKELAEEMLSTDGLYDYLANKNPMMLEALSNFKSNYGKIIEQHLTMFKSIMEYVQKSFVNGNISGEMATELIAKATNIKVNLNLNEFNKKYKEENKTDKNLTPEDNLVVRYTGTSVIVIENYIEENS